MTLGSMKVFKWRVQEIHVSGLYSFVQLPSSILLLFCLFLLQSSTTMFVTGEDLGVAPNDTQDTPNITTQQPCTEVSIDALWLRLDFHNGRLGSDLEKDLSSETDDIVSSGRKGDKPKRSSSKKQLKHNLKSNYTSNSSEIMHQTKYPRPSKRHSIKNSRRHHNRSKRSTATSPSPTSTAVETTIATSTSKKFKQSDNNKRKRSNTLRKRNSESVEDYSPWLCQMTPYWETLDEDTIPRYIKSGNCTTNSSCHQGSYECVPKKYVIKVLKKLKNVCYPVPSTNSEKNLFEEAWIFVDREVTVACECAKIRSPGIYISNPSG